VTVPDPAPSTFPPGKLLRVSKTWIVPGVIAGVLIALITVIYIGSVVNPSGHLNGLPVEVVNQDTGVSSGSQSLNIGDQVVAALAGSSEVTDRLSLHQATDANADSRMDKGKAYATVVIPADFSRSLGGLYGLSGGRATVGLPTIQLLTNQRAGSLGANLATGVLQPALTSVLHTVATKLGAAASSRAPDVATTALRADPVTLTTAAYRPLPNHSAIGLSAFYIALLTLMCGFLGGTLTNSSIDSASGFAPTETGPKWRLRRPLPMTRWHTLVTKWAVITVLAPILVGLMLIIAIAGLHMYAPNVLALWLFSSFAAIVVGLGTLVFFAIFGSLGQLLAMLVFLYLSLASSGGTIPIEALPEPLRWAAEIEPLRQILGADRAIMYFHLTGDAGLTRGLVMTAIGLGLWLLVGFAATRFYDRRGLARISPEALAYIDRSVAQYRDEQGFSSTAPGTPAASIAAGTGSGAASTDPAE
jgi:YhgE/Pip-like protein